MCPSNPWGQETEGGAGWGSVFNGDGAAVGKSESGDRRRRQLHAGGCCKAPAARLKTVKVVNFMSCVFYQNKNNWKRELKCRHATTRMSLGGLCGRRQTDTEGTYRMILLTETSGQANPQGQTSAGPRAGGRWGRGLLSEYVPELGRGGVCTQRAWHWTIHFKAVKIVNFM